MTLYSLPEILFLKRHGLKGLYSWGVSWGVAYVPTMQLKKLATMRIPATAMAAIRASYAAQSLSAYRGILVNSRIYWVTF